jgi:hypothetical protein
MGDVVARWPVTIAWLLFTSFFVLTFTSCDRKKDKATLFTKLDPSETGIRFENNLTFDASFNIYTYRNYYNGGGVAIGDVNNDGLMDVYLSGNMTDNKLYLNKGNFQFEDITESSGTKGTKSWSTGVSMADVNGDGFIDIYVCNSGDLKGAGKENELFINNGDLTFTDVANEYNIADPGFTTHAAFFDYDKDNDLDLYILNNSYQAIGSFNLRKNERPNRDPLGGDKLMRNDGNVFTDVSEVAGIYGSVIGFGLGVTVGDVNKDGWQDMYISNDFFERDYLYINNQDGTFKESLVNQMNALSAASMGADLADINNDSYPDVFVTDMLPKNNSRLKTVTTFENWDRYQYNLQNDYHHQFTRNTLQLNNGNGTFSEIGRLAGVEATDWSWGAFMFDADNDGLKDIFVANGIYQDLTNQDYLQYVSSDEVVKSIVSGKGVDYKRLVELIPSNPVPNFIFRNQGDLRFKDMSAEWGMGEPDFSNGTAYGDLDNDGDLDLVLNNVNSVATVFRNEADTFYPQNRFLKFELIGTGKNTAAFGTSITITTDSATIYIEQMPIRGFESTMDPRPNVGLGTVQTAQQILVRWPDDRVTTLSNVPTNQTLKLSQEHAQPDTVVKQNSRSKPVFAIGRPDLDFKHIENEFVDFDRDRLLFHMLSSEGPRMSKGDINGDGREDFFVGGARDQRGAIFIQMANGDFASTNEALLEQDKSSEDTGSEFFDVDGDGDLDLYVCSGGNEFSTSSIALADRLYINNGKGNFTKKDAIYPDGRLVSSGVVKASDFDKDGDQDLFVGVRLLPFLYGAPQNSFLLVNDGKGNFSNAVSAAAPGLKEVGMVTDASWTDVNADGLPDLVVVGEYMPIKIFINSDGKLNEATGEWGTMDLTGWWNRIEPVDVDNDGDMDFIVGNHGENSRFRASRENPVCMYLGDFDQNATVEHVICTFNGDKNYPMVLRQDLVAQIPSLKKKYLKFDAFKDQTITDIFTPEQLARGLKLEAAELRSGVLRNEGGKFEWLPLPAEAQFAPIFGIEPNDFDDDGLTDLIVGGNFFRVKPEAGRYDASYGLLLKGNGDGTFATITPVRSGIVVPGEVRDMITIMAAGKQKIMISRNNDHILSLSPSL